MRGYKLFQINFYAYAMHAQTKECVTRHNEKCCVCNYVVSININKLTHRDRFEAKEEEEENGNKLVAVYHHAAF